MLTEITIAVSGALLIADAEDEWPLIKVQFFNELADLTDEEKFKVGRAILTSLGAESLAEAMGDATPNT